MQRDCFGGQQRGGHTRQRRVLRPAYRNATMKGPPASDSEFIHGR
jgi:hypothetical protein